ncbi:MAG: TonB family protein [Acidobacteriota bacterium]
MFETVSPETFVKKSHRTLYGSLPVSLVLHGTVVGAAFLVALWNVSFPQQSPRVMVPYSLIAAPPPPPPPPPPAAVKAVVQPTQPVPVPKEIVAPTVIPDTIPVVSNQLPKEEATIGVTGGVEGGIEGGVVGGSLGGVEGGEIGGLVGGTPGGLGTAPVVDNVVHVERDRPLPMHPISQVYPIYPNRERLQHLEDTLVVRYLIGTNGRVKEVTVISHAERKVFEEVAVKAIRNWRFRPMIKEGQPKEVEHELTVNFRLEPES